MLAVFADQSEAVITAKERQTKMAKTTHTQTRIEYTKYFLTGTLKGLTARCNFTVPAEVAHERMLELQAFTEENPGKDCITGTAWVARNIGSVWIEADEETKFHVTNLETDEAHGDYETLDEARGAVRFDRLEAYSIWHQGVRVEHCEPYRGKDARALQGLGQARGEQPS